MTDTQDRKMISPKRTFAIFAILPLEKDIWWPDSLSLFPGAEQQTDFNFWSKFYFQSSNYFIHIVVFFSVMHVY